MLHKILRTLIAALSITLATTGCDPIPGGLMTTAQKEADLAWAFTIFDSNYAPLAYKAERWGMDYEKLKKKTLTKARATKTNEEFYAVMQDFVANFHDAHTSLAFTPASLPGRSHVAFAGFMVDRQGDDFVVREILPIVDKDALPVKVGDKIIEVNGKPVKEYIDKFVTKYRNLGNAEANYSLLANMVFFRDSLKMPMPEEATIKLKVEPSIATGEYAPKFTNVEIPWAVRDYSDFKVEIQAASKADGALKKRGRQIVKMTDSRTGKVFPMAFLDSTGRVVSADKIIRLGMNKGPSLNESFHFLNPDNFTFDSVAIAKKLASTPAERLKAERNVPKYANFVDDARFYPAYVYPSKVMKDGKPTGKSVMRGYIRIDTFSPDPIMEGETVIMPDGETIRKEIRHTLASFQEHGVSEVFVDTVDNPGGSLELLLEISQAFSNKKIDPLTMQTRLNENWVSDMENGALNAKSPSREVFAKTLASMKESIAKGNRMSESFPLDVIAPFQIQPNTDLKHPFKKLFILVNEGNASCGDIFPAIIQDNKLGTIVGRNTMGAGGNVTSYDQAPNSHATLRQTESLIVRKDGSYLENHGVKPEVELDFNIDKKDVLATTLEKVEKAKLSTYATKTEFDIDLKTKKPAGVSAQLTTEECLALFGKH